MDRETKIDLGSCSIASYLDERFVLIVSTSLTLRLPEQYFSAVQTAAELRDHIKQGKLWAVRASSCQLDLCLRFEAWAGFREDIMDTLLSAFEACPVWQTLGLQLRREIMTKEFDLTPDMLHTFYLQHDLERSALIAPENVPCVYISNWHCGFSFGVKPNSTDAIGNETLTPKTLSKIVTLKLPSRKLQRFAARKRPWGQMTIEKQRQQPGPKHEIAPTKILPDDTTTPDFFFFPTHLQNERLGHLIHAALSSILGLRRRFADIRVDPPPALCLVDIAPTVFHSLYLQGIVARMQSASLISSSLGNLASTQSPILRQKILDLQLHQMPQANNYLDAVKKSINSLILRSTSVPKITIHAKKTLDLTESPREDTDPGGRVQKFDGGFTPCYDDFVNDDIDIYCQQRPKRPCEDDSIASNGMQWSDDSFWIPETGPTTWGPTEDHISYGENDFEHRDFHDDSDSEMLEASTQYQYASTGSHAQQLSLEIGDRYHMETTSSHMTATTFGPGSQQEPPNFEDTYEDDDSGTTYMHTTASLYEPDDFRLITAQEGAEYLLPEANSAEFFDTQEAYSDYVYELSNMGTVFYDHDLDDDNHDETENGYLSDPTDNILSHDDMCPIWYGPAIADDEANYGDNLTNEENEAVEQIFEISSHFDIGRPDLRYDVHGTCRPEDNWGLNDASQAF